MEQIAHRVDEDPARLLPAQRIQQMLLDKPDLAVPLRHPHHGAALVYVELHQPLIRQPRPAEPVGDTLRIAVPAALAYPAAAAYRVPRRIRPRDSRLRPHQAALLLRFSNRRTSSCKSL